MANISVFESADWGASRITNYETRPYVRPEINICERLLETNRQVPPEFFERAIELDLTSESMKLANLREKYQESVNTEKVLMANIEELTTQLKKYEESQPNVTKIFTELRAILTGCEEISLEKTGELIEIEGKYIDKMKTLGDLYLKFQNQKYTKLKEELQTVSHELSVYREVLHQFLKDIIPEEKRKPNTCSICFDNEVNRCLNPCGHSFCNGCSAKLPNACPTCRAKVITVIPLFL